MKWFDNTKSKTEDYLFDHPKVRQGLDWAWKLFITVTSCFIFAWGFRAFINPNIGVVQHWLMQNDKSLTEEAALELVNQQGIVHLISGGASGFSQALVKFIEIFADIREQEQLLISIFYFAINVPLFLLAWFKISKQFTIFTLLNVGFVSLFNYIIPDSWIYNVINIYDDMVARCIFGGICTGIASGSAMMIGTSAGGSDVISFYIAEKKSTTVGHFAFYINGAIIVSYVLFAVIGHTVNPMVNPQESNETIRLALYTLIYLFVSVNVIDLLNTKNKKVELQIFTSDEKLPQVLIHAFPHSATIIEAKGAYTGNKRLMIYMVVSKNEKNTACKLVHIADPSAFMTVINIDQVYGRFYMKPIE